MPKNVDFEKKHPRGFAGKFRSKPKPKPASVDLDTEVLSAMRVSPSGSVPIKNSGERMDTVSQLKNLQRLLRLARTKDTSKEILGDLAEHIDSAVRKAVAGNHSTPADVLGVLVYDGDIDVAWCAAQNVSVPAEKLSEIYEYYDDDEVIRWYIAQNPSTPSGTINRMVEEDDCPDVRITALWHKNADTDRLLPKVAKDPNWEVRLKIAERIVVPDRILQELARDDDEFVAEQAISTLAEKRGKAEQEKMEKKKSALESIIKDDNIFPYITDPDIERPITRWPDKQEYIRMS